MDEDYVDELARDNGITREEVIAWLQNDTRDTALKAFSTTRTGAPPAGETTAENPRVVPRPSRGPNLDATLGGQRPVFTPPEPEKPRSPNYTESWIGNPTTNFLMKNGVDPQSASYAGLGAGIGAGLTPALGTMLSGLDAWHAYKEGDYGDMVLNGVGAIPVPLLAGIVKGIRGGIKGVRIAERGAEGAERLAKEAGDAGRVADDAAEGSSFSTIRAGKPGDRIPRKYRPLPEMSPQSFESMYPKGTSIHDSNKVFRDEHGVDWFNGERLYDNAGRIRFDPEGRRLTASKVVGFNAKDGPNIPANSGAIRTMSERLGARVDVLPGKEFDDLAGRDFIKRFKDDTNSLGVPKLRNADGFLKPDGDGKYIIYKRDNLNNVSGKRVEAHETGHLPKKSLSRRCGVTQRRVRSPNIGMPIISLAFRSRRKPRMNCGRSTA